jgi:hypothetical protein
MDKTTLVTGKLIYEMDYELLRFEDSTGRVYEYNKLNFLTGRWQSGEGYLSYPGIMVIQGGNVITEGDTILGITDRVLFKDIVIILGSLRNLIYGNGEMLETKAELSDFERTVTLRNNDFRILLMQEDGEGNIALSIDGKKKFTANAVVRLAGKEEGTGHFTFDINGGFIVQLTDKNNEFVSTLTISGGEDGQPVISLKDKANNNIQIDTNGIEVTDTNENKLLMNADGIKLNSSQPIKLETDKLKVGNNDQLLKIFNDLFAAMRMMTFGTAKEGMPTIPVPKNWVSFQSIQQQVQELLSP